MYITAPPVNYSILCLSSIVHIVAFVNLLLKKMVVVVAGQAITESDVREYIKFLQPAGTLATGYSSQVDGSHCRFRRRLH